MKQSSIQKRVQLFAAAFLVIFSFGLIITPGKATTNIHADQAVVSINVLDLTQDPNGAFEIRLRLDSRINLTYAVETFAQADATYAINTTSITLDNILVKSVVAINNIIYTNTTTSVGIQSVTWNSDNSKATLTLEAPGLNSTVMKGGFIKISNYTRVGSLSRFDEYVVHGFLPEIDSTFVQYMANNVTSGGKGLFFWGGYYPGLTDQYPAEQAILLDMIPVKLSDHFTIEEELYLNQSWVGQIELKVNDAYPYSGGSDFTLLQRSVVWESSPLVKERIYTEDAKPNAKVLVYQPEQGRSSKQYSFTEGEPLVVYRDYGKGKVLWVSMCSGYTTAIFSKYTTQGAGPNWNRVAVPGTDSLTGTEANKPFYLWPYFNFFLYQSAMYLANKTASQIDDYSVWPLSPIPHQSQAVMWMMFVAALWVFNFVLFFTLGKKKKSSVPTGTTGEASSVPQESKDSKPGNKEMTVEEQKAAKEKLEEELLEVPGESEESRVLAGPRGPGGPLGPGTAHGLTDEEKAEKKRLLSKFENEKKPEDENS